MRVFPGASAGGVAARSGRSRRPSLPPRAPDEPPGLTTAEAAVRLRAVGPNRIPSGRRPTRFAIVRQFTHLMALLLWIGGLVAFLAELPELGAAIWLVNLINGGFAAWQEHRAERAASALQALLPPRARVIRDGVERVIDAETLVPGDLVLLAEGDRVSVDARLVAATGFAVSEVTLTGEPEPVVKTATGEAAGGGREAEDARRVFAGTMAVRGWARALVETTGARTRVGRIARATIAVSPPPSPLLRELHRLTRTITVIALSVGAAFFLIAITVTELSRSTAALFALGMVVAFVPEGLLPTVTISLARSTHRMAARNALVRRPTAVEALGATSVICCDKTGTLTEGHMVVAALELDGVAVDLAAPPASDRLARAARVMGLCHDLHAVRTDDGSAMIDSGDPTELALLACARRLTDAAPLPRVAALPFDYERRRMTTVHADGGRTIALCKGAPEAVLARCVRAHGAGGVRALDAAARAALASDADAMAARGLRVLALADLDDAPADPATAEEALVFVGLVGLRDPPRPEVPAAIARCQRAGIRVIMLTGDHPLAALAIGRELRLVGAGARVITGEQLDQLDDDGLVAALAADVVFARVQPEDKLRITATLQRCGEVVAVTGDGTNDAPALRQADVGVAMGRGGTDLAREAADVILLDDNFASIVDAVEEGRTVYANIKRFTSYIFTSNTPEALPFLVFALSGGEVPLALGVMAVLAIDLGTDMAPALALGAEPPEPAVMQRPPRRAGDPLVSRALLLRAYAWLGLLQGAAVMLIFLWFLHASGHGHGQGLAADAPVLRSATGLALAAVVATQTGNLLAHRARGGAANPLIVPALLIEYALLAAVVYAPPLQRIIGTAPFPPGWWLPVAALVPLLWVADRVLGRDRGN